MARAKELFDYYEKVRERTRRVVELIPEDRFDWTASPGKFSLGDLVRHLGAIERFMYAENARLLPSLYPGHGKDLADGREAVLAFFDRTHVESMAIFRELTDEDLEKKTVTPGGASLTVWKWLRLMVEHEIHHRGQIYFMLGLLGIETPPIYGLTSEEVKAKSALS